MQTHRTRAGARADYVCSGSKRLRTFESPIRVVGTIESDSDSRPSLGDGGVAASDDDVHADESSAVDDSSSSSDEPHSEPSCEDDGGHDHEEAEESDGLVEGDCEDPCVEAD